MTGLLISLYAGGSPTQKREAVWPTASGADIKPDVRSHDNADLALLLGYSLGRGVYCGGSRISLHTWLSLGSFRLPELSLAIFGILLRTLTHLLSTLIHTHHLLEVPLLQVGLPVRFTLEAETSQDPVQGT